MKDTIICLNCGGTYWHQNSCTYKLAINIFYVYITSLIFVRIDSTSKKACQFLLMKMTVHIIRSSNISGSESMVWSPSSIFLTSSENNTYINGLVLQTLIIMWQNFLNMLLWKKTLQLFLVLVMNSVNYKYNMAICRWFH